MTGEAAAILSRTRAKLAPVLPILGRIKPLATLAAIR
jgi:hypothetical protein